MPPGSNGTLAAEIAEPAERSLKSLTGQIDVFKAIVERSHAAVYPALGNHDLTHYRYVEGKPAPAADQSVAPAARREWSRSLAQFRSGTYYAFRKQVARTGYLLLALDNGETAATLSPYGTQQMAWLKEQIASHPGDTVILAMHIPLQQNTFSNAVKAIIADAPNVALTIAGHRHTDGVEDLDLGARSLTQVRTAALFVSEDNWRVIRLREDRIEIAATGKPEELVKTICLPGSRPGDAHARLSDRTAVNKSPAGVDACPAAPASH